MLILGSGLGLISLVSSPWGPHRDTLTWESCLREQTLSLMSLYTQAPFPSPRSTEKLLEQSPMLRSGFHHVQASFNGWSRAELFTQGQQERDGTELTQYN